MKVIKIKLQRLKEIVSYIERENKPDGSPKNVCAVEFPGEHYLEVYRDVLPKQEVAKK